MAISVFPAAGRAITRAGQRRGRTTTTSWCRPRENPDGSAITGRVMARIMNASGKDSRPMIMHSNPMPYRPASPDTREASLATHASETIDGTIGATAEIAPADWAFAKCSAGNPFPGTPDPTQICLKNVFDPNLLYQVTFTA